MTGVSIGFLVLTTSSSSCVNWAALSIYYFRVFIGTLCLDSIPLIDSMLHEIIIFSANPCYS